MKKILVTGATGFLGKYLTQLLKSKGYEVLALGRNAKAGEELQKIGTSKNRSYVLQRGFYG